MGAPKREQCSECDRAFRSGHDLQNHRRQFHNEEKLKCETCEAEFGYLNSLRRHKLNCGNIGRNHKCVQCEKKYKSKETLQNHIFAKHAESKHICQFCGKQFHLKCSLTRHVKNVHNNQYIITNN